MNASSSKFAKNIITEPVDARRAAMNLLAQREHSVRELNRKLAKRVSDYALLEKTLDQLEAEGLLSDSRFTEAYVRYRSSKGFGPIRVAAELREKGVNNDLIQDFVDANPSLWHRKAKEVRQKKFGDSLPSSAQDKAKQIRFVSQRGFTQDQVQSAMEDSATEFF